MNEHIEPLRGQRILVVEDDYVVAVALAGLLEVLGASVVGPIGWANEALSFVELGKVPIDAAVLDLDLHGENSYAIAQALASRQVHFVFATGHAADEVDPHYRDRPRCTKPFDERALINALLPRSD
ncbi:response regulator [Paraburkholderia megapolitana]|uniref:response regulator n=1 Tax=Paraburkholderia megapolitana TaxID=420953 RepID=UPI0038BD3578